MVFAIGVTAGALAGPSAFLIVPVATLLVVASARQRLLLPILVAFLGVSLGAARVITDDAVEYDPRLTTAVQIEGTIDSVPQIGPSGPRATIDVSRVHLDDEEDWQGADSQLLVFFRDTVPAGIQRNDTVHFRASVQDLASLDPDFRRFVRSEGASGVAFAFTTSVEARGDHALNVIVRLRERITQRLMDAAPGDPGALLAGFVTGDDSGLSAEARGAFDRTNTSHITAVSGANVAILISMWTALAPYGRLRRHAGFQLLLIVVIWSYIALVGFGPAALRAGLFATLMIPTSRLGRKPDPMSSLMLASAILLLIIPEMAQSVGFWLSMAASVALVTVIPVSDRRSIMDWRWVGLGVIAAQCATLPITFWIFGQWSPASFLANMLIAPLVSVVFPIAFVSSVLLLALPVPGALIGWIPGTGAGIILATVEGFGSSFPMLRSGPVSSTGVVLIGMLCAVVIGCFSSDARRWILRIEFAHRDGSGVAPAVIVGALGGASVGLLLVALL